jgi:hypothetical protein
MIELIAALLFAMLFASLMAFVTLPKDAQVPMQWTFRGTPTWTLPKIAAVLFTPCLAVIVSGVIVLTAGSSERASAILPLIAGSFLVAHVLHLVFAKWHFNAKKS